MPKIRLITVYDNYPFNPQLQTGWGFSCYIRCRFGGDGFERNILFDTGADSVTLLSNMEKLEIDPKQIEIVFLSHNHNDHVGGLQGFLKANGNSAKIYYPTAFSTPANIFDGIYSTGALGSLKEQSLVVLTEKGLVIITGCAHPGIVEIIETAKEFLNERVYLVLGGFHLSGTSDAELKRIIREFRELGVKKVAPCHCSGARCRALFKEEYKENFIENGVGRIIDV